MNKRHRRVFAVLAAVFLAVLGAGPVTAPVARAVPAAPMVLKYDLSYGTGPRALEINLVLSGTVNVTVDWGDGSSDSYTAAGGYKHVYASVGVYTVSISGTLSQFGNRDVTPFGINKLVEVVSWGDVGLTSLAGAFLGASNLTAVPSTLPTGITNFARTFERAGRFNDDIHDWDTSAVTDMFRMFDSAMAFNQDLNRWDTSNVTSMFSMFRSATAFAGDISTWNTSKVTTMESMFQDVPSFNSDISKWDTGNVTSMAYMFADWTYTSPSRFNADLSQWDTSKVTNMDSMFENAVSFNADISGWDTGNVTSMWSMFEDADSFNRDIGRWNTGKVATMNRMFAYNDAFDQDIGDWNVSALKAASRMFDSATLSVGNYDRLLIGWAKHAESKGVLKEVPFSGGNSRYSCSAIEARATLTGPEHDWNVFDAGLSDVPGQPVITRIVNGDGEVEVQFDAPECPDSPEVENYQVSVNGGDSWITIKPAVTSGPFIIGGLVNGVRYPIMIRAINDAGVGSMSNLRYGRPVGPEPVASGGDGSGQTSGGSGSSGGDGSSNGTDGTVIGAVTVSVATPETTLSGLLPATGHGWPLQALAGVLILGLGALLVGAGTRHRRLGHG